MSPLNQMQFIIAIIFTFQTSFQYCSTFILLLLFFLSDATCVDEKPCEPPQQQCLSLPFLESNQIKSMQAKNKYWI